MNHFKFKSLAFYGVAITSVLLLFKTVTIYGEKNLKAPPPVNGQYRLTLAENLLNCEKSDTLTLNIEQSGIYLNASVLSATDNGDTNQKHSLAGIFRNQQLNLSGKVGSSILCNIPRPQNDPLNLVKIQMQLVDKGNMTGKLTINEIQQTRIFTAIPQKAN
ncbi:hypothetical protein LC605_08930 [Nostoc sp. CHAB 5836]|uniref:hypothetical protein n=1 Tax=Nostoc sp. CHAB 5836 TaxID=2780404 RepID=UPI001E357DC7|nr:hypothetical protein [Nostoc sp. CHAB 5836]MCC5615196.1 hypothetical protein [Nostoc sp. CHAB 5836]